MSTREDCEIHDTLLILWYKPLAQSTGGGQNLHLFVEGNHTLLFICTMDFRTAFPVIALLPSVMNTIHESSPFYPPSCPGNPSPHCSGLSINSAHALSPILSSLLWDFAAPKFNSLINYLPFYPLVYKYTLFATIFKINNKQKRPNKIPPFSMYFPPLMSFYILSLLHRPSALISHSLFPLPTAVRSLFPPSLGSCLC